MARPKLDYINRTIGTLKVTSRLPDTKHARFTYTCISCGDTGERDARYMHRGCNTCKSIAEAEGTVKRVTVVTSLNCIVVTPLQILMALRRHPDTESTPEPLRTRFYYEGKRVKVTEDELHIHLSQPAKAGQPVRLSLPKVEQELEEGYSWTLPPLQEAPVPPEQTDPFALNVPDPFATHIELPKPPKPPPPPPEPLPFIPPPEWIKLERPIDAAWLSEDYPAGMPPLYLTAWFEKYPDADYRIVHANGDVYGAATVKPVKKVASFYSDEDEATATKEAEEAAARIQQDMADAEAARQAAMRPKELAAHLAKMERTKAANKQHAALYKVQAHPTEENKAEHEALKLAAAVAHAHYIAAQNEADIEEDLESVPKPKPLDTRTPEQRFLDNAS